jgi:hypothetical protein
MNTLIPSTSNNTELIYCVCIDAFCPVTLLILSKSGMHKFKKNLGTTSNSRWQKDYMNKVPYQRPTNIVEYLDTVTSWDLCTPDLNGNIHTFSSLETHAVNTLFT